ncbi:MAG TPA: MFS transporter, partial [Sphingobium sp.]|nr:MFS transporter [Sphingobium sp.]
RGGFIGVGAIWLAVSFPIVFLFFREGPRRRDAAVTQGEPADVPGLTFRDGIRTRAFFRLLISFGCFSFYSMTIATNIVPLLAETGVGTIEAARIAAVMGVMGIFARLSVGFLLDHFPGHIIGTGTLLMPVLGCAILLTGDPGVILLSIAVATFGAAIGAEMDVALYLATRHFGLKAFAALFSAIITFGALNAAIGPYAGGRLHDLSGNYDTLLVTIMVVMSIGALAMATLGPAPRAWARMGN